ncbi:MAG: endolytic transglycosylase MltG [Clostridia bacterium]|nr:endolytic transglycosylase MltG [Clostridia bacterium]
MSRIKRKSKSLTKFFLLLFALFFALAFGVYGWILSYNKAYNIQATESIHMEVEAGMSTSAIAQMLEDRNIIESALLFKLKSKFKRYDGNYQAGVFELSPSMPMEDLMKALMHGQKETVRFTIPEGFNVEQTVQKLSAEGLVDEFEFMDQVKNGEFEYRFLDGLKKDENRLEGFLFPDTYEIFTDASEGDIIDKMLSGFDAVFTEQYYSRAEELGLSVHEVVTIASLIEEESRVDTERALVSSVIYNRLNIKMNLSFCSTVLYALGEQKARLLYSDLEVESPYNTYKNEGLPPGPISSPGKSCIEAALYPADTDYLFFVLKGDGSKEHNFAENETDFFNYKEDYLNTLQ